KRNLIYSVGASAGKINWAQTAAPPGRIVLPPVLLKDRLIVPTNTTLEQFDSTGRKVRSVNLARSLRSGVSGEGHLVYAGFDYAHGGRFAQIDVDRDFN